MLTISPNEYVIRSIASYSADLEYGTSAHWIFPRNKQSLHWKSDGKDFFSKGHKVSGINAQPFMRPTITYAKRLIKEMFK